MITSRIESKHPHLLVGVLFFDLKRGQLRVRKSLVSIADCKEDALRVS